MIAPTSDIEHFRTEIMVKQCELLDNIRRQLVVLNKSVNEGKLINPGHMAAPDLKVRAWVKKSMKTSRTVVDLSKDEPGMKFNNPDPFPNSKGPRFSKKR